MKKTLAALILALALILPGCSSGKVTPVKPQTEAPVEDETPKEAEAEKAAAEAEKAEEPAEEEKKEEAAEVPEEPAAEETPAADEPVDDSYVYKRVIIIGVDGAGAFFKDAYTPNLDEIFKDGAVTYKMLTSEPTISGQCWGSMLHGVTPKFHQLTNSRVDSEHYPEDSPYPSIFRVVRENMPDANLASFCNWNPINYGIIEENLGVTKGTGNDASVTSQVIKYVKENDPTLVFIQFDEVDGAGHSYGYSATVKNYMNQITTEDGYIKQIYDAYDEMGYIDDTLFIVTADHGGSGTSHGGSTDAEKYVMFAAAGKTVSTEGIVDMQVRDITAVTLYALGLEDKTPEMWTSIVPTGVFKGVTAKERKVIEVPVLFEHRNHEKADTPAIDDGVVGLLGKRVKYYFTFDNDCEDCLGNETEKNGKLYYVDGYFGEGAQFDDGYISIPDYTQGNESFSAAFWTKTGGIGGDPSIFSNKDWNSGGNPGYILSFRDSDIKFNLGNGSSRMDVEYGLPMDYEDGWVYVVFVVDRENNTVSFSYDFEPFRTTDISPELKNASFDSKYEVLNIGQDGTGKYSSHLSAVLDEFIFVDGVLTADDVAALKELYN